MQTIFQRVQKYAYHPIYPLLLFICNFLDVFLLFFPLDVLLVGAILAKKGKWLIYAFVAFSGNMSAGILIAFLLYQDPSGMSQYFSEKIGVVTFEATKEIFYQYGLFATFLGSITFFPFQIFLVIGALTNMKVAPLLFAIACGRAVKYLGVAGIARFTPWLIQALVRKIKKEEMEIEDQEGMFGEVKVQNETKVKVKDNF